MEKDGADKATTELENSVTSKEDNSLAEKNEKNNGLEDDTEVDSAKTGRPTEAIVDKVEEIPEKEESEERAKISSEDSIESKSAPEAGEGKIDEHEEAPAEEITPDPKEEIKTVDAPEVNELAAVDSVSDPSEAAAKPKEIKTKEPAAETGEQPKSEEVSVKDEEPEVNSIVDTTEEDAKPKDSESKEAVPEAVEQPKSEEVSIKDEEPEVNDIAGTAEEDAKPKDSESNEAAPELGEQPKSEEVSVKDEEPEVNDIAGTADEDVIPKDSESNEAAPELGEQPKSEEASVKDEEPEVNSIADAPEEDVKPKESESNEPAPEAGEQPKSEEVPVNDEVEKENNDADADTAKQTEEPTLKDKPKGKGKKTAKEESASADKIVGEHPDTDEHHDEYQNADFTTYSKEELVEVIKNLGKDENPFLADRILKVIAPLFNQIRAQEREAALKKFIAEGGVEDDFQYRPDELSLRFDANYKLIKDKKTKKFKEQDLQRSKNLIIAEEVLNELRDFVDSEESSGSFNSFKAIQQKWKDIGDVPSQNSRTLWANYNALIHRFYDQRSIYFELKELDRKKNYESKLILCDKAEALVDVENLREAIKGLNELHHEFKHMGPVPQEVQEELWQRFKAASDKVYERRKAFVHELKAELHENLGKKQELIEKIKLFTDYQSDRIKEWNEKTKELIALQNAWEKIGGLPKDKAKQINKEFWSSFKKFFSNKHLFFKKLDADRDEHLIKKQALLAEAKVLKDSEEWDKTANELKNLQSQWREIGPVPEKMRKKLYDEFKACCDHFFEKRRVGFKNSNEDYKQNLKKKKKIIDDITKLGQEADKNLDKFNELRKEFLELGFVPKKNITSIKEEYQNAVEAFLNDLTVLNVKQKTEISLEAEFASLAGSEHSETELYHKEQSVRRQINKLEDDIALWQNNLEFFAHSKSTDKLREEVNKKIDDAAVHVESLKRQLKMLRTL